MTSDIFESGYPCLVKLIGGVYLINFVVKICQIFQTMADKVDRTQCFQLDLAFPGFSDESPESQETAQLWVSQDGWSSWSGSKSGENNSQK